MEYAIGAVVGAAVFFILKRHHKPKKFNNNLAYLVIKQKKLEDSISKRSKGGLFS